MTVMFLMAGNAKRNSVIDFIGQFGMMLPFLDMVRVKFSGCAAFLARAVITRKNCLSPKFVFVRPTATTRGFVFVFSLGEIRAFFGAVRMIEMAVFRLKKFPASFAGQHLACSISAGINPLAMFRAGDFIKHDPARECFAANDANALVAIWAVIRSRVMNYEKISASLAVSLKGKGLVFHNSIIPHFLHIQRWVDMTGGTPELLCNGETT